MTQFCRYCQFMIIGDWNYCEALNKFVQDKRLKSPNRCKEFQLNPIDAMQENKKGYEERPRVKEEPQGEQLSIEFDIEV